MVAGGASLAARAAGASRAAAAGESRAAAAGASQAAALAEEIYHLETVMSWYFSGEPEPLQRKFFLADPMEVLVAETAQ